MNGNEADKPRWEPFVNNSATLSKLDPVLTGWKGLRRARSIVHEKREWKWKERARENSIQETVTSFLPPRFIPVETK
jgi:hypothetical protein